MSEATLCPGCAGVKAHAPAAVDVRAGVGLGLALQTHARTCDGWKTRTVNGVKVKEPCHVCVRNAAAFATIPATVINNVLTEQQVHVGRSSICELSLFSMLDRKRDQSKRARADFLHAYPVLKGYEERGGKL